MVDAVLLVLREVLEAALMLSLLLALSRQYQLPLAWSLWALLLGVAGSWLLANNAYAIAEALDGTGQEILNALLYAMVALGFIFLALLFLPRLMSPGRFLTPPFSPTDNRVAPPRRLLLLPVLVAIVSLSLMREGSEIWIYLSSFQQQPDALMSALIGAVIGTGIGMSLGAITYYVLIFMHPRFFLPTFLVIITLLAGGLAMQIAKALLQIGMLDSAGPVWDSSFLVAEQSWLGELLYALLGYDAQPTPVQLLFYGAAITPVLCAALWHWVNKLRNKQNA
ncbi:FTR1 family protein [Cellvibrio fontiphilus]|uniref:FTR1 family protein n=1 Tax=Cellvibrio fontiphilus TaxID=1815559 RepID=A0ABV7FHC1_9GAMM